MSSQTLLSILPPAIWRQGSYIIGPSSGSLTLNSLTVNQGLLLSLLPTTFNDNITAASSSAAFPIHSTYFGAPTITATNTSVTTATASTVTIAGPPIAGTNETITNTYALNVLSGTSRLTNWTLGFNGTSASMYNTNVVGASNTTTSFALYQGSGGDTVLNTATGTQLGFKVNNVLQFSLLSTGGLQTAVSSISGAPGTTTGSFLYVTAQTFQDTSTAASGTVSLFHGTYLGIPTLAATNTSVTTTTASTLTIAGAPTAGTNETITNTYALNILSGNAYFGGNTITSGLARSVSGNTLLFKQLTGTIASGLANNSSAQFTLSGFDTNFVSASSGTYVTVPAGIYIANVYVHTGMPTTGTGSTCYMSIGPTITGTNAVVAGGQTILLYNWASGNGVDIKAFEMYYLPSGGSISIGFSNVSGAALAQATSLTWTISSLRLF